MTPQELIRDTLWTERRRCNLETPEGRKRNEQLADVLNWVEQQSAEPGRYWWFAIDKDTLKMVEVAEGTPGAYAFQQAAPPVDPAKRERARELSDELLIMADDVDSEASGLTPEITGTDRRPVD